jgi:predicted GNAT family acetyltransferase
MEERAPMSDVRDNAALGRVEMTSSGGGTAFVEYRRAGERIARLHTEVPEALSGQGVGSKLVRGTLDALRAEGRKVAAPRVRGRLRRAPPRGPARAGRRGLTR